MKIYMRCAHIIWLYRTKNIRKNCSKLLISYQKSFKPVSIDTISRWLKTVLAKAGINTKIFTVHSTRSASSSSAKRRGLPINIIMNKVGWSSASTFSKFYDEPIGKNYDYGNAVLQSCLYK